ncbi:Cct-1p [Sparganum proliferum]
MVMASFPSQSLDDEVGDGTTSVVILAAELLRNADKLISQKIHPTRIISGYRLACREACKYIQNNLVLDSDSLGKSYLVSVAKTSMSSKLITLLVKLLSCLQVVKRVLESKSIVPGAGACEAAVSIFLENFAMTMGSREQLAVAEFARAMLVIPKQLSVNAALDSTDLVSRLRACHNTSQLNADLADTKFWGLDLTRNWIANCKDLGIFELLVSKIKSLKFATEAAITILRIDDLIKLKEEAPTEDRE